MEQKSSFKFSSKYFKNSEVIEHELPTDGNGFIDQIKEVNRCIISRKIGGAWSHKNSRELAKLLENVKRLS